jgi:uncharacterized protein (DUF427 family)
MAQAVEPQRSQRDPKRSITVDPSPRWVRVIFNGESIASSKRPLLLVEPGYRPVYYFPRDDVRMDLLESTSTRTSSPGKGDASHWSIRVGDRMSGDAAWSFEAPIPDREDIRGHIAFYWDKVDAWYEEAELLYKHPRDPRHRVDVLESSRHIQVTINGQIVADSRRPRILFETGHPTRYYIPPEDVRMDLLTRTDTHSRCPYKGEASYWTARIGDQDFTDIVWSYQDPIAECPRIKGYLSFFNEKVDVAVDGEPEARPITSWS